MRTIARLSVVAAAAGILTCAGAPLALAQTAEYTGTEDTSVQDTSVQDTTVQDTTAQDTTTTSSANPPAVQARTTPASTPSTLPFTGGEVVLIAAAGTAAVAAGAGLVVGGRRRVGATR